MLQILFIHKSFHNFAPEVRRCLKAKREAEVRNKAYFKVVSAYLSRSMICISKKQKNSITKNEKNIPTPQS